MLLCLLCKSPIGRTNNKLKVVSGAMRVAAKVISLEEDLPAEYLLLRYCSTTGNLIMALVLIVNKHGTDRSLQIIFYEPSNDVFLFFFKLSFFIFPPSLQPFICPSSLYLSPLLLYMQIHSHYPNWLWEV